MRRRQAPPGLGGGVATRPDDPLAHDRRPDRTARPPRPALTRWSQALGRREHWPADLRRDSELWRLSRVQPIFGSTTEIMKEITGHGPGLKPLTRTPAKPALPFLTRR